MVATGLYYALLSFLLAGLLGHFVTPWAAAPLVLFGLFCLWFFRDPEREIPRGAVAVSPADGKVVLVRHRPERTEVCTVSYTHLDVYKRQSKAGVRN